MLVRKLVAAAALLAAAVPGQADAAQRGRSVLVYSGVPQAGQEVVTFACGGAAIGLFQSVRCSISPYTSATVAPNGSRGVVTVPPPSFTLTLTHSVQGTDGNYYSCSRSVTVTFTTGVAPVAGTLECIV